ncbi:MAG: hypothetical protein V1679_03005 [Candidatus Peregrinibacteria bacterium]
MTNKHASKQHCLVGNIRPKSKLRKRRNKAKAKARREERLNTAKKAPKAPKAPASKVAPPPNK